jgi:hypothetical protein
MLTFVADLFLRPVSPTDLTFIAYAGGQQERLHEVLEWRATRGMALAKGTLGTAASLLAGLLLAQLKHETKVGSGWLIAAVAGSLLVAAPGLLMLRRLAEQERVYPLLLAMMRVL